MFLTTVTVAVLLGAMVSYPLLVWGRRLDRRRLAVIEGRCVDGLAVLLLLLLALVLSTVLVLMGLWLLVPVMIYVAVVTRGIAWRSDPRRWRAALNSVMMIVLFILLADLVARS